MNTQSILPGRFGGQHIASGAAILLTLLGIVPISSKADESAATTTTASSVADVPLTDLDLSTAEGMRLARDRLRGTAERVCAEHGGGRDSASQPAFGACVDSTVTGALRQIDALSQTHATVRNSVIRGTNVSLGDLDLSTLEGARIARERLQAMAQRLCGELARHQDMSYRRDYAGCVRDSLAGALAQADALAAARNPRSARRTGP
jgi:UrcA family protein